MVEKKSEKIEIPEKFKDIIEKIEQMSVLELAELVKILEEKFGVSAQPAISAVNAFAPGQEAAPAAEEKSSFNIELKSSGDKKIEVIKVVKEITGKGLKEAKDLVDSAPAIIKEGVSKQDAQEFKEKIEAAGGVAELK